VGFVIESADAGARSRRLRIRRRAGRGGGMKLPPYWLALPGIAFLIAQHFVAPLFGAWYAFTDWDGLGPATYVGLDNFRDIFASDLQRSALWHTLLLAACFVIVVNIGGLALALALNRALKLRNYLRVLFFAPVVVSSLAVGYLWRYIFTQDGALNTILDAVGLDAWARTWLGDPKWAIWTVLVVMVWQFVGEAMIIYLAALQGIADELEEAAVMDGAPAWRIITSITLPLLAPAITIVSTLSIIRGLRVFDQVIALTGGGPVHATETLSTQVYKQTFVDGRFGYGAAIALIMTVLIATLAIVNAVFFRRREARAG
jgi:raffinose/stachyose/melibiose transport system permease protein